MKNVTTKVSGFLIISVHSDDMSVRFIQADITVSGP